MTTFLDTKSAAQRLVGVKPRTLEKWRIQGRGPVFRKFGRKVVYAESDLEIWAEAQRRLSTSRE
jgi:hypothetical protein